MNKPQKQRKFTRGQNLVELAFSLPLIVVLCFFIMELGRVWHTYETAKMAANEGAHTAAIHHNEVTGTTAQTTRLNNANMEVNTSQVIQIANQHAYQSRVVVTFRPAYGAVFAIPTVGGDITIIPDSFPIEYTAIKENAVY